MLALIKATVNLPGLPALRTAYADVDDPKIARYLRAKFVVFVDPLQELEWLERQHAERGENDGSEEADSGAVPVHGAVRSADIAAPVAGTDGAGAEAGDVEDGAPSG